jgi:two-component system OmpR family response regulator
VQKRAYYEGMNALVLVVEDEPGVRELVSEALSVAGHQALVARDGLEAINLLQSQKPDLIISDVNMPKLDGFAMVEKLRDRGIGTPVIFLTARNEKPDVGKGFRIGADDYVAKPFGIEELVLRVNAVLRRTSSSQKDQVEKLVVGPISVDLNLARVERNGEVMSLSPTEFRLLVTLMENQNKVLSRQYLLDVVWGMGFADSATVVDTYISYLRRKLHTQRFEGIRTVRGFGFQITES